MTDKDRWWRSLSDIYDHAVAADPHLTRAERAAVDEFMALQRRTTRPSEGDR